MPSWCGCCGRRRRCTSRRRAPIQRRRPSGSAGSRAPGSTASSPSGWRIPYLPDKRALVKVKHERTADCAVAGYRIHKDGNGVGSLLLGLYDDEGDLQHVGVAASFSVKRRAELLAELEPLTHDAVDGHPWADWAEWQHTEAARKPGATSRWNAGKDLSWVPIRVELVAEVTFGQLEKRRFRHGVSFVRWRPDRTPESCRYEQLEVAAPVPFEELVSPS